MNSKHPVLIAGGGLAGLSCANLLSDAGQDVRIYESSDGPGGRIRTDIVDGFRCDRGFQVLLTAYPEARAQLDYDQLNLKSFVAGSLIRKTGKFHRFVDPWRHPLDGFLSVFGGIGSFGDKLRVARLRWHSTHGSIADLFREPERTTEQALREYGFSDDMISSFFRPFLGGVFLERELQTSSRVLHFVFRMFSQGHAALPALGMAEMPIQLANRLPESALRLNCEVTQLSANSITLADGSTTEGSRVVLATPAHVTRSLLGSAELGSTEHHASRSVRCFYYSADTPPINEPILVLNGDDTGPINNLCVPSLVSSDYAPTGKHLISISVVGEPELDSATLSDRIREQALSWFGDSVRQWSLLKEYTIQHALPDQLSGCGATPGHAKLQDGIIVAGDHLGNASIQSALESGRDAARMVLESA